MKTITIENEKATGKIPRAFVFTKRRQWRHEVSDKGVHSGKASMGVFVFGVYDEDPPKRVETYESPNDSGDYFLPFLQRYQELAAHAGATVAFGSPEAIDVAWDHGFTSPGFLVEVTASAALEYPIAND